MRFFSAVTSTGDERAREKPSRRNIIKGAGLAVGGLAVGAAGGAGAVAAVPEGTPKSAMAIPVAGPWRPVHGHVDVTWSVDTSQKLVALTFDDGPMPNWTGMVHDILDAEKAKATFFMVGERAVANARIIHGRMDRHEAGNHTWAHQDMSRLTHDEAVDAIHRAHKALTQITGKEPRHLRPPYGQLGGTTMSAAGQLGYDLTLWGIKMLEKTYEKHPQGLVDYIVNNVKPGTIVLAHDHGNADRLVALRNLSKMIRGLRAKGFEFVTISELVAASGPPANTSPTPSRSPSTLTGN